MATRLRLMKYSETNGGGPLLQPDTFAQAKLLSDTDRVMFKLTARMQNIIYRHRVPGRTNWAVSEHFSAAGDRTAVQIPGRRCSEPDRVWQPCYGRQRRSGVRLLMIAADGTRPDPTAYVTSTGSCRPAPHVVSVAVPLLEVRDGNRGGTAGRRHWKRQGTTLPANVCSTATNRMLGGLTLDARASPKARTPPGWTLQLVGTHPPGSESGLFFLKERRMVDCG